MTLDEFEERKFTAAQIEIELKRLKHCCKLVDTRLPHNPGFGQKCRWGRGQKAKFIDSLRQLKVPSHFAYIKFYAGKDYTEGTDTDANHIFALVSGKTSYSEFYKTDVLFSEEVKDGLARKWLSDNQNKYLWYLEKVLVFWSPKAEGQLTEDEDRIRELAHSVESDVRNLFGLFSS